MSFGEKYRRRRCQEGRMKRPGYGHPDVLFEFLNSGPAGCNIPLKTLNKFDD